MQSITFHPDKHFSLLFVSPHCAGHSGGKKVKSLEATVEISTLSLP
jgi:hypothetical protein